MVVLDTCAILELCLSRPSFGSGCIRQIEEGTCILSVSFAEIALKVRQKKLVLDISPAELFEHYAGVPTIRIVDIGFPEWFDSINL